MSNKPTAFPPLTRRSALVTGACAGLSLAAACVSKRSEPEPKVEVEPKGGRMPAIFLAHGAPPLLEDTGWMGELRGWAERLPKPKSVLMLSAHWENRPIAVGATRPVPLIYDFYGFPKKYYRLRYSAPGAPELASRIRALLEPKQKVVDIPERGLDHGAYVPLLAMYPEADVPVLQVSLPSLAARDLFQLGQALSPLRNEGVLIVGSGFLTHNLRRMDRRPGAVTPTWAKDFDAWCAETLANKDVDALFDYQNRAPGVRIALPTHEHFAPVSVALGAAADGDVSFPITGFWFGSMTRRSAQFG